MRCRNCGHQNPEENRFCGRCGHLLVGRPAQDADLSVGDRSGPAEYVVNASPVLHNYDSPVSAHYESPLVRNLEPMPSERDTRLPQQSAAAPMEIGREPAQPQLRPIEIRKAEPREVDASEIEHEAVVNESPVRSEKWWVDESETTVGGPSFLGLSNADASGGSGYSYLLQEEEERSHKAGWAFLLVLVVLVGVVYAKWQPIRDYVLTSAFSHARPQRPAAQDSNPQAAIPASSAPTTTLASSDAQAPPITTEIKTEPSKPDQPNTAAKEGLPEVNRPSADNNGKTEAKPPEKQQAAVRDETSADEEDASASDDEENSPPARKARAAQINEGGELVNSGERYLYGRGVPRSCDQAVSYFNAAAAKQNPQAFSHLGALYATGECVPMDRAVAYAWFRRAYAKEPANHYFEQNLSMLWREMTPGEKQRATGRQ